MNKQELKELIKIKEAELKQLKAQLKELNAAEEESIVTYNELAKKDAEEIRSILEKLDIKQIKKIAKQGAISVVPSNKEKAIKLLIDTIEIRSNKGWAFK